MTAGVDPDLCEHSSDYSTEDESIAVHTVGKRADKPTPARDKKPYTAPSPLCREGVDKNLELPAEIPDSQESLDLSESGDQSPGNSFHTEDTIVIEGGTKITAKPTPKYVSSESIIFFPSSYFLDRRVTQYCTSAVGCYTEVKHRPKSYTDLFLDIASSFKRSILRRSSSH